MVVKMMKWRPRQSKKFEAKITLHHLRVAGGGGNFLDSSRRFSIEITWKGSPSKGIIGLRKKRVRRNFTKEQPEDLGGDDDGVVVWDEEFRCVCSLSSSNYKDRDANLFHPWELSFALLLNGDLNQGTKNNNVPVVAIASLNLADFASAPEKQDTIINIPLSILPGGFIDANTSTTLHLSVSLLELKVPDEPSSILSFPRSPCYGEILSSKKEAIKTENKKIPTRKRSKKRVNIFEGLSAIRAKRTIGQEEEYCSSDGNISVRSDNDDMDEVRDDSRVRKSFDYGPLAYANNTGASSIHCLNTSTSEDEDWIYYSHSNSINSSVYDHPQLEHSNSKRGILLPWRKRKLSFRSPKVKGEPLLRKDHRDQGGDDIDFDRRHLSSSSDESTSKQQQQQKESGGDNSPFGDDNFAVGTWESKEIISRDGEMKLKTQVFFASIDQRSESAAGESACTALVAVIADWFQSNADVAMLIKSQLDSLIREGSLEWRNLCENETYRERFPDKHFDLDTVLEAKVRPISVVPEKSFVGFFRPQQGIEEEKGFDFLQGVMSFDDIWDEIMTFCGDPLVYIISWNDHFFVLKVEEDAFYIIDTLGERLYEGCNKAFILKFDRDTVISRIVDKPAKDGETEEVTSGENEGEKSVVCVGKESCKEYIKNFLAAIPIRELEVDLKKGLMASTTHLHHRLQIEFHYTRCLQNLINECSTYDHDDDGDGDAGDGDGDDDVDGDGHGDGDGGDCDGDGGDGDGDDDGGKTNLPASEPGK